MDMIFRDDECRIRTEHAPANFTTLKHMAHNLIRKAPRQAKLPRQTQNRRLGRRLHRKSHCRMIFSPDSPGIRPVASPTGAASAIPSLLFAGSPVKLDALWRGAAGRIDGPDLPPISDYPSPRDNRGIRYKREKMR
jgi:hypothetical protein